MAKLLSTAIQLPTPCGLIQPPFPTVSHSHMGQDPRRARQAMLLVHVVSQWNSLGRWPDWEIPGWLPSFGGHSWKTGLLWDHGPNSQYIGSPGRHIQGCCSFYVTSQDSLRTSHSNPRQHRLSPLGRLRFMTGDLSENGTSNQG